jgi:hypothetical protein
MPQQEGYIRWPSNRDIPLTLTLAYSNGTPATGKTPQVSIRRYGQLDGTVLDNYYWDGSSFVVTPTWLDMTELDDTNSPGTYVYDFGQKLIGLERLYHIYYRHTVSPVGFAFETHIVTNEIFIPSPQPDPVIVGPQSVMGQLELVKGLLHHNSMLDNQVYVEGRLVSARLRMFDSVTNIPTSPGGSETAGRIAEFSIESAYDAVGLNNRFVLKRVYP